jgi:hypothetical protein
MTSGSLDKIMMGIPGAVSASYRHSMPGTCRILAACTDNVAVQSPSESPPGVYSSREYT